MRILFTRFPLESALGGAEIQTLSLMEGLMEHGHAVAFAGSCPVLLTECKKRKIPVVELQIGKPPVTKWSAVSFAWRKESMKHQLVTMLKTFENLDAVVMLSVSEKLLLTDSAADAGTKVLWVEHDRIGRWLTKNPWLPMLLKQSEKATTITVSELSKKIYIQLGWNPKKVIAIPNGVTLKSEIGDRRSGSAKLRLGCIARLSHEKGVDVLINALADVPQNFTLEIIGTGREEQTLRRLAHKLTLDDRITFTSHESNVGSAFERWDVLVLPSRDNDPFGMVAAEAMLAGLPVIVTDQCGIADYLEDGKDALIVKANSSSDLAKAISEIGDRGTAVRGPEALRPEWEIGKEGKKTAENKFTVKRMVEEYETAFSDRH